jgi:hypothetical protein
MLGRPTGSSRLHGVDPKKVREADAERMASFGWLVTSWRTLVPVILIMFVMNAYPRASQQQQQQWEHKLDTFLQEIQRVDLSNEDAIKATKEKITKDTCWKGTRIQEAVTTQLGKLNEALWTLIGTRSLRERLSVIEAHLAADSSIGILGKDFAEVRDLELKMQAGEAGGDLEARYVRGVREVTRRYLDALRTAANAAASATTAEQLAPYGSLEDTIRSLLHDAMANRDKGGETLYAPMYRQTCTEINAIVAKMFDEAYQTKVPWTNLLADAPGWTLAGSSSFRHRFGAGLTLVNQPGVDSSSGGLSYTPADKWRDYVIEVELELDSGSLVFYTRIGDKMDTKEVPGFTVGMKSATIPIEYGRVYDLVIRTIGNQLTVTYKGELLYAEDIKSTKSRKGEPGIVAHAGTTATITKLRARHLR